MFIGLGLLLLAVPGWSFAPPTNITFRGTGTLGTDAGTGSSVFTGDVLLVEAVETPLNEGVYSIDPAFTGAPASIGVDIGFAFLSSLFTGGMETATVPFLGEEEGQGFALPYDFLQTGIFTPAPPVVSAGGISGGGIDFMMNPDFINPSIFSSYFGLTAFADQYDFWFSATPAAGTAGLYDFALYNIPTTAPVPEPGVLPLLALGLAGLTAAYRRTRRS